MAKFDVKDLIQKAHFDYVGPLFPLWFSAKDLIPTLPNLNDIGNSLKKGQPFFYRLRVQDIAERIYEFPNEPLVTINLNKTIVETAIIGESRQGTVKEYINTEDYQLTIRGVCVDLENKNEYPATQVKELNDLFAVNESLEVVGLEENNFFPFFNIERLAFKSLSLDEMVGEQGMQRYTITAVSDQPFFAELKERDLNSL